MILRTSFAWCGRALLLKLLLRINSPRCLSCWSLNPHSSIFLCNPLDTCPEDLWSLFTMSGIDTCKQSEIHGCWSLYSKTLAETLVPQKPWHWSSAEKDLSSAYSILAVSSDKSTEEAAWNSGGSYGYIMSFHIWFKIDYMTHQDGEDWIVLFDNDKDTRQMSYVVYRRLLE